MHRRTTLNTAQYRLFYDLFPNVVRDAALWPRMAELFRWYRELDAMALAPGADEQLRARVEVLTSLTVAICDGLAMQHISDPDFDLDPVFELYERIVRRATRRPRRSRLQETRRRPETAAAASRRRAPLADRRSGAALSRSRHFLRPSSLRRTADPLSHWMPSVGFSSLGHASEQLAIVWQR